VSITLTRWKRNRQGALAAVIRDPASLGRVLDGADVGLVPTMGALHEGHLALIRRSVAENARTVMSLFVNPTQFSDPADLVKYPRDFEQDVALAGSVGVDIVYAPDVEMVYPPGFATAVEVTGLTDRWEGAFRPGHFRGVTTVVTILLNTVRPARSYFGEKDFQQVTIVRRMHRDLLLPGEIVGCPTVRDDDGLALSSRNRRLSPADREIALAIPRSLLAMADLARQGEQSVDRVLDEGRRILNRPELSVDYLAIVDPQTLDPLTHSCPGARAIVAATVGDVRLIDNMAILWGDTADYSSF
jgi:pantoate--beta-alanine ligase